MKFLTALLMATFLLIPGRQQENAQSSELSASPWAPAPRKICSTCAERVSMIQLIATPDRFNHHVVLVEGYTSLQFEEYAVYLSRADYDDFNTDNALWISFADNVLKSRETARAFQGKRVVLEGTFVSDCYGHLGSYPGCLRDITRIDKMLNRAELEDISKSERRK